MHLPFHSKRPKARKSRAALVPDNLVFDDGRQVKLVFSFNRRAKRIILKMDPALRAVKITCPSKSHIRDAIAFARTRQNWIESQLAEAPRPVSFEAGNQVPFRGTPYEIVQTPGRSAHVEVRSAASSRNPRAGLVGGGAQTEMPEVRGVPSAGNQGLRPQPRQSFAAPPEAFAERIGARQNMPEVRGTPSAGNQGLRPQPRQPFAAPPEAIAEQSAARQLIVTGRPEHIARRLKDWMKREARADFTRLADEISREAGLSYSRLAVRDMRTRWGSCSSEGALCFNWRLILAPPFVLRGVVAHEVAHLKYLNHGKKFWDLVRELDPDNDRARDWLDAHGANLWVYGVTAPTAKTDQSAVDAA
jgi:predicted metal-dependent hydrolase